MRRNINVHLAVVFWLMLATAAHPHEIELRWNTVTNADGYKVYHGLATRMYGPPEDVEGETVWKMTTYVPGVHYFAVTAYNYYGESGYSVEVETKPLAEVADLNKDGVVTGSDYFLFMKDYIIYNKRSDFNDDGAVTGSDFNIFRERWSRREG